MCRAPTIAGLNAGVITAASSAIFFALTIMLTKRLTRTQTITCILFYLTVTQLVLGWSWPAMMGKLRCRIPHRCHCCC